jgi:hypothetical protein
MSARPRTPALAVPARQLLLELHPRETEARLTRNLASRGQRCSYRPVPARGDSVAICFRRLAGRPEVMKGA